MERAGGRPSPYRAAMSHPQPEAAGRPPATPWAQEHRTVGRPDGLSLDVHLLGPADGPVALLLHGFPQGAACWHAVAPRLAAAGLRVVVPDQRGYSPGARPSDAAAYALPVVVADALAVLDDVDAERALVVGHDWGAIAAWGLAGHHPDRVRALVAVSLPHPRAYGAALRADPDQQARSAYMRLFREVGHAEDVLLSDGAARLRAMYDGSGLSPEQLDAYVEPFTDRALLAGALGWYRAMTGPEFAAVPDVEAPTTFLWGDQDLAVGRQAAQLCGQFVTGPYRFQALAGASHWLPDTHADAVVEAALALTS